MGLPECGGTSIQRNDRRIPASRGRARGYEKKRRRATQGRRSRQGRIEAPEAHPRSALPSPGRRGPVLSTDCIAPLSASWQGGRVVPRHPSADSASRSGRPLYWRIRRPGSAAPITARAEGVRMSETEKILEALRTVRFPGLDRDIVSLGYVKDVREEAGRWIVSLEMSTTHPSAASEIEQRGQRPPCRPRDPPRASGEGAPAEPAGPAPALSPSLLSGHPDQDRRRERQGGRGEIDRRREPRPRAGPAGAAGRAARLRHLRPERAADDGDGEGAAARSGTRSSFPSPDTTSAPSRSAI